MHYDGKSKVRRASLMVEKDSVGVTDDEMNDIDDDEMFVNYKEMIQNEAREHERIVREMRFEYVNIITHSTFITVTHTHEQILQSTRVSAKGFGRNQTMSDGEGIR